MGKILLFGDESFICQAFLRTCGSEEFRSAPYTDIDRDDLLDDITCVVNFALHPLLRTGPYDAALDIDTQLARRAAESGAHYVMLSSRKVYDPESQWQASEGDPASGIDDYGRNKAAIEKSLLSTMGRDKLTILRIGNVIGREYVAGRRSFMGMMLSGLKDHGAISYNMSPFVRRDFLTAEFLSRVLARCAKERPPETINVSSGIPIMTGELAMWVLEGYGSGQFVVTDPRVYDEFCLRVAKQHSLFGLQLSRDEIRDYCLMLGRDLADV